MRVVVNGMHCTVFAYALEVKPVLLFVANGLVAFNTSLKSKLSSVFEWHFLNDLYAWAQALHRVGGQGQDAVRPELQLANIQDSQRPPSPASLPHRICSRSHFPYSRFLSRRLAS